MYTRVYIPGYSELHFGPEARPFSIHYDTCPAIDIPVVDILESVLEHNTAICHDVYQTNQPGVPLDLRLIIGILGHAN